MQGAKKALMVIDMQPNYATCNNEELQRRIYHKMYEYMEACLPIMIVEYRDYDTPHDISLVGLLEADDFDLNNEHERTIACLWDEVKDYPFMQLVSKWSGDGTKWIAPVISDKHGLFRDVKLFELIGINLQYCVVSTATGLANWFPKRQFDILYDYCNGQGRMVMAKKDCKAQMGFGINSCNLKLVEIGWPDVKADCGVVQEFSLVWEND